MAVTAFNNGFSMTAAGDVASSHDGRDIVVTKIYIVKTTAGTITFKDGDGSTVLVTESIANGASKEIDFPGGWQTSGLEYDATSAGSAVVTVFCGGSSVAISRTKKTD